MDSCLDYHGNEIKKGDRVCIYGYSHREDFRGTVQVITDPDGDADDWGRSIYIYPRVTVLFDDGQEDSFTTTFKGVDVETGDFFCFDLEKM